MQAKKEQDEKRRHRRWQARSGVFAISGQSSGAVIDISLGGLSYFYIARRSGHTVKDRLDLVFGEDSPLRVDDVPFRLVAEHTFKPDAAREGLLLKRRHLSFGTLPAEKLRSLEEFIRLATAAAA